MHLFDVRYMRNVGMTESRWVLLQIPLFVTAVIAVRRMSLGDWPGFETGIFWLPAVL